MKDTFLKQIDQHMIYVYNIAVKMLGEEDAKDAAQEAILKAYRNYEGFRGESKISTWLYRITINVCKDMLKKRKGDLSLEEIQELPGGLEPSDAVESLERRRRIRSALAKLSSDNREILVMRYTLGYEYEEISAELGIPVGTVKSRLSRAKLQLRKVLSEEKR